MGHSVLCNYNYFLLNKRRVVSALFRSSYSCALFIRGLCERRQSPTRNFSRPFVCCPLFIVRFSQKVNNVVARNRPSLPYADNVLRGYNRPVKQRKTNSSQQQACIEQNNDDYCMQTYVGLSCNMTWNIQP